jgi:hypothetical protein
MRAKTVIKDAVHPASIGANLAMDFEPGTFGVFQ